MLDSELMAKTSTSFVCQSCGASAPKWSGKCEACGGWNTITEEGAAPPIGGSATRRVKGRKFALEDLKTEDAPPPRRVTGIAEFDRVCGGGLVPGSALLVGGDPGIGKSTLILQALGRICEERRAGGLYLRRRGDGPGAHARRAHGVVARRRWPWAPPPMSRTSSPRSKAGKPPGIVAIDSIQTLWTGALDAAPGTIAQVRTASFDLVRYAKSTGAALILVGHVTKDGQIAGPKAVEHLVDAVLYFEGERGHHFRVLRAVKNRFGPTDEIGVFEMTGKGLAEVANPSALFLGDRESARAGHGGVRRPGRHPAAALRNPGAGGARRLRHAAPRRGGLGHRPAGDDPGGAGCARRAWELAAPMSISTSRAA